MGHVMLPIMYGKYYFFTCDVILATSLEKIGFFYINTNEPLMKKKVILYAFPPFNNMLKCEKDIFILPCLYHTHELKAKVHDWSSIVVISFAFKETKIFPTHNTLKYFHNLFTYTIYHWVCC